ncbi:MAG TPA: DEAD/DEAH box helicase [Plasticicumulans sp.]|uniref:DEAD/DEAH box helicase n=1 Tax=Plasticicumulans sp. TaxID=2307179 RepID=UPI002B9E2578|nr:DEAD/DEAH box helicase [Plasticicumulans sp.]HNG47955.1 DEAD/DEAH box helicase [Plasticicumulans sp.]
MSFSDLSLDASLLRALTEAGYSEPTPIQAQAIPAALEGHDLIASAQTGTGKTAAFMLPALQRFAVASGDRRRAPRVLVLTPTRELAAQVMDAAHKYGRFLRFTTVSLLGGMPYGPQLRALGGPLDLVVATPGRLIDHLDRDRIDLSKIEVLVLDEADRMLDLGFKEDVERIAEATPAGRQTLLFTATLDGAMARLAAELTRDAVRIAIEPTQTEQLNIEQRLHVADDLAHKHRLLDHLLNDETMDRAIIFSATKRDADALAERLRDAGLPAAALHGDMHQTLRSRTLARLRDGRVRLLVATDVAARGIDVQGITHVINFDLPKAAEDYVHRIGRTGRAGRSGIAISLASYADVRQLERIERYTGKSIEEHVIEGLEPSRPLRRGRPGGGSGRGRGGPRREGGGRGYGAPREGYRSSAPRGDRPAGERRSEGDARPAAPWRPREDDAARAPREHTARPFAHRDDAARRRRSEGERRHDGAPRRYRED